MTERKSDRHPHAEDVTPKGYLALRTGDGRRRLKLNAKERKEFSKRALIERVVVLFQDTERNRTWKEIAEEAKITVRQLHDLTRTDLFQEIYNEHYADLGHDPRVQAAQAAISDLVMSAVKAMKEIVIDPTASDTVRLATAKEILRLAGVREIKQERTDRSELQEFLKNQGVVNINVSVPNELAKAEKFLASNTVIDVIPVEQREKPLVEAAQDAEASLEAAG